MLQSTKKRCQPNGTSLHNIFIDLCEEEIGKGNRPNSHFFKTGWNNIEAAFNQKTEKTWNRIQLKNHWDSMKNDWKLFKSLMRGETGLGCDATKKTIDADESWWDAKIAVNKEYKKFRGKDLSAYWFRYDAIFSDIAATGMRAQATTEINANHVQGSEYCDANNVDEEEDECESNENKSNENNTINFESSSLEKKRKAASNNKKQAKQKVSRASSLKQNICDLVDLMKSSKSTATSNPPPEGPSIKECLDMLHSFPSDSLAPSVRYYASIKFAKKEIREIFMGQPNDDERIGFLQFLYEEKHKKNET